MRKFFAFREPRKIYDFKAVCFVLCLLSAWQVRAVELTHEHLTNIKEWASALSLQAAIWGGPLVTMYALRAHDALDPNAKARPNALWRMENITTPQLAEEAAYVTPNVNVIYGFGFMDLRAEPLVLTVPNSHHRYYMVQMVDMWTNSFAYAGGKSTGYEGGQFALVGPHWQGTLPPKLKRIDCPTPWVLLQPRVHIYNNGVIDLDGARLDHRTDASAEVAPGPDRGGLGC